MITLHHGDCLEYLKTMGDKSVDLILQDPPYNTTACKWEWDIMTKIDEFWVEWKRVIKDNGAIVMTASQPFTSKLVMSNLKMFKYEWVWEKNRATKFLSVKYNPLIKTENIVVFVNNRNEELSLFLKEKRLLAGYGKSEMDKFLGSNTLYAFFEGRLLRGEIVYSKPNKKHFIVIKGKLKLDDRFDEYIFNNPTFKHINLYKIEDIKKGKRKKHSADNHYSFNSDGYVSSSTGYSNNIIRINCEKNVFHPTQKPVALMEYLIKTYTNEGDTVFDGFMGSGTTGVACKNLKRNFIGCELDEKYFATAEARIATVPEGLPLTP